MPISLLLAPLILKPSYGPGNYQSTRTGHDIPIYVSQGAVQGLFLKESIFSNSSGLISFMTRPMGLSSQTSQSRNVTTFLVHNGMKSFLISMPKRFYEILIKLICYLSNFYPSQKLISQKFLDYLSLFTFYLQETKISGNFQQVFNQTQT